MKNIVNKIIIGMTVISTCSAASATSAACTIIAFPPTLMLNVSAGGWATREEPQIACTIINPEISIGSGFAFFSETTSGDAVIEVKYVDRNFPVRFGDDWRNDVPPSQQGNLSVSPRIPAKDSDAVVILHTDAAFYPPQSTSGAANSAAYRFGVCAYGYPKSGRAWTSVSITSLRNFSCPWQGSIPPVLYFER